MPLTDSNIVQVNSGGFNGSSVTVTLPSATQAGNTLVLFAFMCAVSTNFSIPDGFVEAGSASVGSAQTLVAYRRSNVPAGESSWNLSLNNIVPCSWVIYELADINVLAPVDHTPGAATDTGTALTVTDSDVMASAEKITLVAFGCFNSAAATAPTFSGQAVTSPTGVTVVEDADQGALAASTATGLSVAHSFSEKVGDTWTATGTSSVSGPWAALVVPLVATNSKTVSSVDVCAGFEWGTAAGLATKGADASARGLVDAMTGAPAIVATTPRTGSYCLELSSTAAAENVSWNSGTTGSLTSSKSIAARVVFRIVGTPAADVVLFTFEEQSPNAAHLNVRWRSASGKIGVQIGTGTEQLSNAAVAVDTWLALDVGVTGEPSGVYTADWRLDYGDGVPVVQTSATFSGGSQPSRYDVRLGWAAATTATVRYDDIVICKDSRSYPLGNMTVQIVKADPAGTVSVVGTAADFKTFTANGTMAAWNDAAALAAIDEIPPTIGASADGIAQASPDTAGYVQIPMATIVAAPSNVVRGVRMLACGWSAAAQVNTIGLAYQLGSETAVSLYGAPNVNPGFTNSTTDPTWQANMVRPVPGQLFMWSQARLDGLKFRMGFSGDATPDVGLHAIYAEVALQPTQTEQVLSAEDGAFTVDESMDPMTGAPVAYLVTTPAGSRGATFDLTVAGTPISRSVAANSTHQEIVEAADFATVSDIRLSPDPV